MRSIGEITLCKHTLAGYLGITFGVGSGRLLKGACTDILLIDANVLLSGAETDILSTEWISAYEPKQTSASRL